MVLTIHHSSLAARGWRNNKILQLSVTIRHFSVPNYPHVYTLFCSFCMSPSPNHIFVHYFMRIIGVKISIHITNFTLIVVHVPFADKSRFYVIFVLYFVVYVTISNYYYLNTLFMYGFCCAPPLQSLFLVICTHFTLTSLPAMLHPQCWYPYTSHNRIIYGSTRH